MQVADARSQLLAAISICHPSPTARWLRQAATACLHYGLQASQTGLQLTPVDCSVVVEDVKTVCPDITDLMQKLQGKVGSKYFSMESTQQPAALLVNLHAIILPYKQESVSAALACIAQAQRVQTAIHSTLQPHSSHLPRTSHADRDVAEASPQMSQQVTSRPACQCNAVCSTFCMLTKGYAAYNPACLAKSNYAERPNSHVGQSTTAASWC